jgi:hypothetical protein
MQDAGHADEHDPRQPLDKRDQFYREGWVKTLFPLVQDEDGNG